MTSETNRETPNPTNRETTKTTKQKAKKMATNNRIHKNDDGSSQLTLLNVRLSFPQLFKAKGFGKGNTGEPKFSASFLFPDGDNLALCKEAIKHALETSKISVPKTNYFVKNGATKIDEDKPKGTDKTNDRAREIYEGQYIVSSSTAKRPQVVHRDQTPAVESDAVKFYGGCYVNAVIRVWVQDNEYGKRINAQLKVVQFVKDGEAFGGDTEVDVATALPKLAEEGSSLPVNGGDTDI